MWIGGDAIMFAFMMLVVLMWARDERGPAASAGWLEAARKTRFDQLTAGSTAPEGQPAGGSGRTVIDDDEHLAAYNAYLARLHGSGAASDEGSGR
jgi:putative copper resistance protein D